MTSSEGSDISYGVGVDNEAVLKLCGNLNGKRVLELGLPAGFSNSIAIATAGARALAADPSVTQITELRKLAKSQDRKIECHIAELGELGAITSGYLDLVICVQRLHEVEDLSRVLRQVHRVLKQNGVFVMSLPHPIAQMFEGDSNVAVRQYGAPGSRNIGDLFMALRRTNFAVDVVHELRTRSRANTFAPNTLILRAYKLGL